MFGMKCFRNDVCRLEGSIKKLPCDFQVTEIDQSGTIVELRRPSTEAFLKKTTNAVAFTATGLANPQSWEQTFPKICTSASEFQTEDVCNPSSQNVEPGPLQNPESQDKLTSMPSQVIQPISKIDKASQESHGEVKLTYSTSNDNLSNLSNSVNYEEALSNLGILDKVKEFSTELEKLETSEDSVPITSSAVELPPVFLGVFHDKVQRTSIYTSVKELFPQLKASVDSGHEMKVSQDEVYSCFRLLLPAEDCNNLTRFVSRRRVGESLDLCDMPSRATRTKLHRLVNQHHGSLLESKTFTDGSKGAERTFIQLRVKERSKGHKRRADGTRTDSNFTGFTLQKENLETLDAIHTVARAMKVQPSDISYAGMKDKKAITVQAMAVNQSYQRVMNSFHMGPKEPGILVGNVHERDRPIRLGELWGNHFKVIVRDVGSAEGTARKCLSCRRRKLEQSLKEKFSMLKKDGFINYFGKQRFGENVPTSQTGSLTADVGLAMLNKDYEKAVNLILTPDGTRDDPVNRAKRLFQETNDAKKALSVMPSYKARECTLLRALHRHGLEQEGYRKALLAIPHRMRQLYIHSFTSLVWNHAATQRITDHGFEVIPGDLVTETQSGSVKRSEVAVVSSDDVLKYTFGNVVLPLPGNMVEYPQHGTSDAYKRLMDGYGLGGSNQEFRLNALQVNVPGDYRRVIETPVDLDWKLESEDTGKLGVDPCQFTRGNIFPEKEGINRASEEPLSGFAGTSVRGEFACGLGPLISNHTEAIFSSHDCETSDSSSGRNEGLGGELKEDSSTGMIEKIYEVEIYDNSDKSALTLDCDSMNSRKGESVMTKRSNSNAPDAENRLDSTDGLDEHIFNDKIDSVKSSSNLDSEPEQLHSDRLEGGGNQMVMKGEEIVSGVEHDQQELCKCGGDIDPACIDLEMSFNLPSSTYATSLLRELITDV